MAQTYGIDIKTMAFPENTDVQVGDTVTWTNRMNMSHTVTAEDGQFDSGVLGKGKSFSQTFTAAGVIDYQCQIHPNMVGRITVS